MIAFRENYLVSNYLVILYYNFYIQIQWKIKGQHQSY